MKSKVNKLLLCLTVLLLICSVSLGVVCYNKGTKDKSNTSTNITRVDTVKEWKNIEVKNPEVKELILQAIEKGKKINPDKLTNPVQTISDWYDFIAWSQICLPWNILYNQPKPILMNQIDQSLDYFYFLLDIPLDGLKDKGLYYNSLEYYPPVANWVKTVLNDWGKFLDTKESWNEQYYQHAYADKEFGLQQGWYEDKSNWHSFNDFFYRKLKDPSQRPIAKPDDDSVVVAPADSEPMGIWKLDENSKILNAEKQNIDYKNNSVNIKSKNFNSMSEMLHGSKYANSFAGGTFTHTFLNVNDYHRYHFPVSGKIVDKGIIPAFDAVGGLIVWDPTQKKYLLEANQPNWESIETRAYVIVQTQQYGLVALLPVAMSQVSSVNFDENIKVGTEVKKGDELGYFAFGGSDYIIAFQKGYDFKISQKPDSKGTYKHILMGEEYGTISKK